MASAPFRAVLLQALPPDQFMYVFRKLPGRAKNSPPFNVSYELMKQRYMEADSATRVDLTRKLHKARL